MRSVSRGALHLLAMTGGLYGGDNLQSQSELSVHFGLGSQTVIDSLSVEWNDGRVTTLTNVANMKHESLEGIAQNLRG